MYLQHVINYMHSNNINGAQLARSCGVSRAAVTKWFATSDNFINVETKTAKIIAQVLDMDLPRLFEPVARLSSFKTAFLWDNLYPSMEKMILAIMKRDLVAMARFVQVAGFLKSKTIFGQGIISSFPRYKRLIKPARRKSLEIIWPLLVSKP